MSANLNTGFYQTVNGLTIDKDPQAQLIYTFDWSEWLSEGDSIESVNYIITTRTNDPTPLLKASQGILTQNTYVELSAGALNKTYPVSVTLVTSDGLIERRTFRVQVITRSV